MTGFGIPDQSITQSGSHFGGNPTVHRGSYHQGNVINIQKTADRCLADLRVTNPRYDKERIQITKGGLLADAYVWVLSNPEFREWRKNEDQQLLWVKGHRQLWSCPVRVSEGADPRGPSPYRYLAAEWRVSMLSALTSVFVMVKGLC